MLEQANWNVLQKLAFEVSEADPCLYVRSRNGKKLILVLYVDDGLLAANDQEDQQDFL